MRTRASSVLELIFAVAVDGGAITIFDAMNAQRKIRKWLQLGRCHLLNCPADSLENQLPMTMLP
ncbi:MAG: hypothetical protein IKF72_06980 [Kiritimatiellae bacterium]|nr:hypothetical protein [Kiritimatiellia bacterium]